MYNCIILIAVHSVVCAIHNFFDTLTVLYYTTQVLVIYHTFNTYIDPAELLSEAVAGDEGVFEEVVRMGLHGAGSVLQHVDAEGMLKEGSKLVAKTVRCV